MSEYPPGTLLFGRQNQQGDGNRYRCKNYRWLETLRWRYCSDRPFIGANQTTIRLSILELNEQMTPIIIKRRMASKTVCNALLHEISCNSSA